MKIPVAILGATGAVGQKLVALLYQHPQFTIAQLCASEKSQGRPYCRAVHWLSPEPIPSELADTIITAPEPKKGPRWIFSALDGSVAHALELEYRNCGCLVFSASSAHRANREVPLIASQVNPEHLELARHQLLRYGGAIIAKPNCVVVGLALTLKPLAQRFGLEAVTVHSMQSVSGGGYPGVSAWDILDNLLPLPDEELKIESETPKVLGMVEGDGVVSTPIKLTARCMRVAVTEGHTLAIGVQLKRDVSKEQIVEAWTKFNALQNENVICNPAIQFIDHAEYPQVRLHRQIGGGMTCVIGSLRPCPMLNWKYLALTHNTIQGAAGGLVLTAELAKDLFKDRA